MTEREILFKAAKIVNKRGLAKGTLESKRGSVCALGAINVACYGAANFEEHQVPCPEDLLATDALRRIVGDVETWNDRPRRRKHEVVAKLREAARSLSVRGAE